MLTRLLRCKHRSKLAWNHVEILVHGKLAFTQNTDWLRQDLSEVLHQVGQVWRLDEAPEPYIERMLAAITGIEILVESIEGKWKVGQNRGNSDKLGVAAVLLALGSDHARVLCKHLLGYIE